MITAELLKFWERSLCRYPKACNHYTTHNLSIYGESTENTLKSLDATLRNAVSCSERSISPRSDRDRAGSPNALCDCHAMERMTAEMCNKNRRTTLSKQAHMRARYGMHPNRSNV